MGTSVLLQRDSRTDKQGIYLHLTSSLKSRTRVSYGFMINRPSSVIPSTDTYMWVQLELL